MNLKSFFKKLFLGDEVLEKIDSPVSGEITVVENLFGGKEMRIGGLAQSGGLVKKLWEEIFNFKFLISNQFLNSNFKCLILGLGGGTVAKLIAERFPESKIVGVEIDPVIVEVGKKHFGLGEFKNLEIHIDDAFKFVENPNHGPLTTDHQPLITKYDLIIVDLYLGQEFPKKAENEEFLNGLKIILADGGLIIFNRLYYNQEHWKKVEGFLKKVRQFFSYVETKKAITNLLIFVSNEPQNKI